MKYSLVTAVIVGSLVIPAHVVYAQTQSMSVVIVQAFGWDAEAARYKILVEADNGRRFFVWYDERLNSDVGNAIKVTYEMFGTEPYWTKLTNVANGKEALVHKFVRAK